MEQKGKRFAGAVLEKKMQVLCGRKQMAMVPEYSTRCGDFDKGEGAKRGRRHTGAEGLDSQ